MPGGIKERQLRVWAQEAREAVSGKGAAGGVGGVADGLADPRTARSQVAGLRGSFETLEANRRQIEAKLGQLSDGRTDRNEELKLLREVDSLAGASIQEAQSAAVKAREFDEHCGEMARSLLTSAREHSEAMEGVRKQARRQMRASR